MAVVVAAGVTLLTGLLLPLLLIPMLSGHGVVDVSNARSSHRGTVVRGGGLAVAAAFLVGLITLALAGWPVREAAAGPLWQAVAAIVVMGAIGLVEDVHGIRVAHRLLWQAGAALVLSATLVDVRLTPGVLLLSSAALVFAVNAVNFMDGINGISSLHGGIFGLYFAALGWLREDHLLVAVSLLVGVAFCSFLPWNIPRAQMFLGDVGSYALGAAAWALMAWALVDGLPVVVAVAPFSIYVADVSFTLVLRLLRRESLTTAHRSHAYQRLAHKTSHGRATALAGVCTATGALTALVVQASHLPLLIVYLEFFIGCGIYLLLAAVARNKRAYAAVQQAPG